jgi:hypothetical protein
VGVSAAWKLKNIVFLNFTTNGRLSEHPRESWDDIR